MPVSRPLPDVRPSNPPTATRPSTPPSEVHQTGPLNEGHQSGPSSDAHQSGPPASAPPTASVVATYRTTPPEQTMARIRPLLDRFGISRVADVTRLDEIGLPTHVAYRPCGRTVAASIGIGLRPVQSWVSAAMESIETWHAENCQVDAVVRAPAQALGLPYDVRSLNLAKRSPLSSSTVVDWVPGRGLRSGTVVPVPLGLVELNATRRRRWDATLFNATSNGLASGNTRAEAILHGLLEVIERDCCAPVTELALSERAYVDPASADHPVAAAVLAALHRADCHVELCTATNGIGIPSYTCAIWSVDVPIFFTGFGCHLDSGLAVARALFEAALSRLAAISGARDDIDELFYANADPLAAPTLVGRELHRVGDSVVSDGSIDSAIRFCIEQITRVTGTEPVVVDLTREEIGIPVVKIMAPGLRIFDDAAVSRRAGERHG